MSERILTPEELAEMEDWSGYRPDFPNLIATIRAAWAERDRAREDVRIVQASHDAEIDAHVEAQRRRMQAEAERDSARRWSRAWKRAAQHHRARVGLFAHEMSQQDKYVAHLTAKQDSARRWAKAWKMAAKRKRQFHRDILANSIPLKESFLHARLVALAAEAENARLKAVAEAAREYLAYIHQPSGTMAQAGLLEARLRRALAALGEKP